VASVEFCDDCGEDLSETPCQGHERRTKIDILFEKAVEHVDAQIKQCPVGGTTLKGRFPSDLHGPRQYGDGLKAFVIDLLVGQMVALKRVQGLIRSMIGELLSEASLLKFVLRLHHALEQWEQRATEQLLGSASLHVDETSLRVNRKNCKSVTETSSPAARNSCRRSPPNPAANGAKWPNPTPTASGSD